jgi:hypothetical protein
VSSGISVIEYSLESQAGEVAYDGRENRADRVYIVSGTQFPDIAVDAVDDVAPASWNGLKKRRFSFEPLSNDTWKVRVAYDKARRLLVNEFNFEFDIGTQSQTITQSKATVRYRAPLVGLPNAAPDYKGAINVQDGRVGGVQAEIPTYTWSETHILPASDVTEAYKTTIYNLAGTKNNATFRLKAAGEVLFLGARGSLRNEDEFSLSFNFAASPNIANYNVNGMLITKKGWDFLWFAYQDYAAGANNPLKQPVFAYVEKIYEDTDFSLLGIGT